jgi:hypothetical protein
MPDTDTDEQLFPNGPTQSEFMAWQKQYPDIRGIAYEKKR